jgi:hypothetical protein
MSHQGAASPEGKQQQAEEKLEHSQKGSWFKIALGLEKDPRGHPPYLWAERANAPVYALIVFIFIPLLGWSGWNHEMKLTIALCWTALFPLYMFLELREITGQMEGRGSISSPQARKQIRTAQLPHIGTILAIVVWLVAMAYFRSDPNGSPIKYGVVEWFLIGHSFVAIMLSNYAVYGLNMELLKSAPRGERIERRLPPS